MLLAYIGTPVFKKSTSATTDTGIEAPGALYRLGLDVWEQRWLPLSTGPLLVASVSFGRDSHMRAVIVIECCRSGLKV
jgi:hypothetical protein